MLRPRPTLLVAGCVLLAAVPGRVGAASAGFRDGPDVITVSTRAYQVVVDKRRFRISTRRGGRTVLATTSTNAIEVNGPNGRASATGVRAARWAAGVLYLTVGTTDPATTLAVTLTPSSDRYRVAGRVESASPTPTGTPVRTRTPTSAGTAAWTATRTVAPVSIWTASATAAAPATATAAAPVTVMRAAPVTAVGMHFVMGSAGHWYGHGEARTADGGPYTRQPWPLDGGAVADSRFGPASYLMVDPFWFTQSATGIWFDTRNLMDVSLGARTPGVAGMAVTGPAFAVTFFVESTPRAVYDDYVGVTGRPARSDARPYQYASPLWNSWAQFYTHVDQRGFLDYVRRLHAARVPGHTMSLDDTWTSHYGDVTFNAGFPDPRAMSREVHRLGYRFGLWVTLWINLDADDYRLARARGYLLRSAADPSKPCTVTWWNGRAGIVDLGDPAARAWYTDRLRRLQRTYGVDGFKFDTRFFDETCAPAPGYDAAGYRDLGARLTGAFDQQGAGVRIHWTGAQRYGFVTREIDKGTGWPSLRAAVAQDLAVSTIGYPFVETDMVGGSLSAAPPSREVLVRWAQAAAAMPLVYSSTSPIRVYDHVNRRWVTYPPDTVTLYEHALDLHRRLSPYILRQVRRTLRTGAPLMQPLFFDFPDDQRSYTVGDEWLLGDSLLAAPVLSPGTSRDVHLPPGEWYDVARRTRVHGDLRAYPADLNTLPLFVRMGTPDTKSLVTALER